MKVATWNVNGIRARASQVEEWLERERPDVVCLQELKAELDQVPDVVQRRDYHAFWHCCKGYSGVSLQLRKELFPPLSRSTAILPSTANPASLPPTSAT